MKHRPVIRWIEDQWCCGDYCEIKHGERVYIYFGRGATPEQAYHDYKDYPTRRKQVGRKYDDTLLRFT